MLNVSNTDWSYQVATDVNKYFKKPYKDGPKTLKMEYKGTTYVVNRPNHALAHGLRQGFLAVDIVSGIAKTALAFASDDGKKLKKWVDRKIVKDPKFKQKIEFAAAFQRTGRQSEASSTADPQKYNEYERADAKNFAREVKKHIGPGKLFNDKKEAQVYKEAILWSTAAEGKINPQKSESLYCLRKIFHAAHDLDLRRMRKFDLKRVKCSAVEELFGNGTVNQANWTVNPAFKNEKKFINELWKRSGEYLKATGDRDVETQRNYQGKFCKLAYNPKAMVKVLHEAKKNSTAKL